MLTREQKEKARTLGMDESRDVNSPWKARGRAGWLSGTERTETGMVAFQKLDPV